MLFLRYTLWLLKQQIASLVAVYNAHSVLCTASIFIKCICPMVILVLFSLTMRGMKKTRGKEHQISMTLACTFIKTLAVDPYRFRNYTPSPFLVYEIWHSEAKKVTKIHNYTISFDTEKLKNLQWVEIIKPFY